MKHICKCGNEASVMSVVEGIKKFDEREVPFVKITFICNKCGYSKVENHYLYKREGNKA